MSAPDDALEYRAELAWASAGAVAECLGVKPATAPTFRAVDQHTGEVALPNPERDQAIRERDDARAELDNMVNLTTEVGLLGAYLKHAIADRDDYREQLDEMREKYDGAQCRMDEMASEINYLTMQLAATRAERDNAVARANR